MDGNFPLDQAGQPSREPIRTIDQKPLIWAIEVFAEEDELYRLTGQDLRSLFPATPIVPVYVLSEESFTERGFSTFLKPALKPMAKKALERLVATLGDAHFEKPRVLVETSASRPACAKKLLRFSEKIGAGRIAIGSHARHGLARFFVGSFSEAVLDQSHLPMLIEGPRASHRGRTAEKVIFPTDFSDTCRHALDEILQFCRHLGAELHLLHKPMQNLDALLQSGIGFFGGGWISTDTFINEAFDDHRAIVEEWLRHAAANGIKTTFWGENYREPTAQAIVDYVNRLDAATSIVAMVSQSGPLASTFFGSITREVIRYSPTPVYVLPREAH